MSAWSKCYVTESHTWPADPPSSMSPGAVIYVGRAGEAGALPTFYVSCPCAGVSCVDLGTTDPDEAKRRAIVIVRGAYERLAREVGS